MTVFYPDVSNNQWGSTELTTAGQQALMDFLSVLRGQGLSGVSHKMSEGADFIDPYGVVCQTWCKTNVFPFIGYHFATSDDAAAQVRNWKAAGGGANVLIDFEAAGVSMATFWDLVFAFNAARINVALAYIPQWFADQIGADLSQVAQSGIAMVSSAGPPRAGAASSAASACPLRHAPQTFQRGNRALSTSRTRAPPPPRPNAS